MSTLAHKLAVACGLAASCSALAQPVIVGWSGARAFPNGALATGSLFAELRADLGTVLEPATLRIGTTITPQLLQGASLAIFTSVAGLNNDPISPLTAAEQQTLVSWIEGGGRALILTDNAQGFHTANSSLVLPLGLVSLQATYAGVQSAFSLLLPFCGINHGPFGSSGEIRGSDVGDLYAPGAGYFRWGIPGSDTAVALAVLGQGRALICADAALIDSTVGGGWAPNAVFRRNILAAFAAVRIRVQAPPAPLCLGRPLALSLPAGVVADSLQWRRNGLPLGNGGTISGATTPTLTISSLAPADFGSYDCVLTGTCGIFPATFTTAPCEVAACIANCDCSTTAPILNVNDFQCFLAAYAAEDPAANCDASTVTPTLNVGDFICFLNQFAAGCP